MINSANQYCTIHIVARLLSQEGIHGWKVDYMGEVFLVSPPELIERRDKDLALVELDATVIRPNGIAAYIVEYAGHELRVHAQQIRFRRFSQDESIYHVSTGRHAIVLANTMEHEPVRLRWLDGGDDCVLPECVESLEQRTARLEAAKQKRQAERVGSVRNAWQEAAR